MPSQPIFTKIIDCLSPNCFLEYFLTRNTVKYPKLGTATAQELAIAAQVLNNEFQFCGETHILPAGFSWKVNPSKDKEWQIAHHKFSYAIHLLHAYQHYGDRAYLQKWVSLVNSWLNEMEPGYIAGNDAQVEARRIERWVHSFILLREIGDRTLITPNFLRRFLERIAIETHYICEHLTPSRNHRTLQLFTIFLVGVSFPEFTLHSYFLHYGQELLTENLLSEILSDGVHIELSTHYHQLCLKSCLEFVELAQMNQIVLERSLLQRFAAGLEFYQFMQHPNSEIPLINDADEGDFRYLLKQGSDLFQDESLLWAATLGKEGKPPQILSKHFERSGYFVFCDTWGKDSESYRNRQHIFYDCAQLGEGTHAHFDLFSFCYYVNGQPAIIDPGRYTYDAIPNSDGINWRKAFKSTAYHNTVEIDGSDQTRYIPKAKPGKFKFGPAVEVFDQEFCLGKRSDWVSAKAKSAEYTPIHQRFFLYMQRQYLLILDRIHIDDAQLHQCISRFHLSPEFSDRVLLKATEHSIMAIAPTLTIHTCQSLGLNAQIEAGWTSKKYGTKTLAPVVTLAQEQSESFCFCTAIAPTLTPRSNIEILSIQRINNPTNAVLLLRIEGVLNGQLFYDWFCFSQQHTPAMFQDFRLTFRGHFLGFRMNCRDKLTYVIAQKAQQIEIKEDETNFQFTSEIEQSIEWLAQ